MSRRLPATRVRVGVAAVTLVTLASGGAVVQATTPAASCRALGVATGSWHPVAPPPAGGLASVGQWDADPCDLVAADGAQRLWRSGDGGAAWRQIDTAPALHRVVTEHLGLGASAAAATLVLGSGPDPANPLASRLEVSRDDGHTFRPPTIMIGSGSSERALGSGNGDLLAAAAARRQGSPPVRTTLYAAALLTSAPDVAPPASVLLKSTDAGRTFRIVAGEVDPSAISAGSFQVASTGAGGLAPTVVAVSPVSPDEVWINDRQPGSGGGAWFSVDGGRSFAQACCPDTTVYDIAIAPTTTGGIVVLLATDHGVLRSIDDGQSWVTVDTAAATGVRTVPGDPNTVVVQRASGVDVWGGSATTARSLPGLPDGCGPVHLRGADVLPAVFLVDCAGTGGSYRLLLDGPRGAALGPVGPPPSTPPLPPPPGSPGGFLGAPRPMPELARWSLPRSDTTSGAIAFGGTALYYDRSRPGDIGMIDSRTGKPLGTVHTHLYVKALSFDLKHDQLLLTTYGGDLVSYDPRTRRLARIGPTPYAVPSYDAAIDGLSWVPESAGTLYRWVRTPSGGVVRPVCTAAAPVGYGTSTYVAAGDGGGYVQIEDDATLVRIDGRCRELGQYKHRVFSEAHRENDALACDTQTFFPQGAVWIRDSVPGTVSAYAVPFGYCPMPSRLTVSAPRVLHVAASTRVCSRLVNATTGDPAVNRPVALSVGGVSLGQRTTDAVGRLCLPYVAPATPRRVAVVASFGGDSALYPAQATTAIRVVAGGVTPPRVHPPAAAAPPPPPPPSVPNPLQQPAPQPGPNAQPAPAAQSQPQMQPQGQPQAQAQSQPQGVAALQRQEQPQLVTVPVRQARLATELAMSRRTRRPAGLDPRAVSMWLASIVGLTVVGVAGRRARLRPARAVSRRKRSEHNRRSR